MEMKENAASIKKLNVVESVAVILCSAKTDK